MSKGEAIFPKSYSDESNAFTYFHTSVKSFTNHHHFRSLELRKVAYESTNKISTSVGCSRFPFAA